MRIGLFAMAFSIVVAGALPATAEKRVALELVLGIDVSLSVDRREFQLQAEGFAHAFRDSGVHEAIRAAGPAGIAVAAFHWSDVNSQAVAVDWTVVREPEEAIAFGDRLAATDRQVRPIGTAVREAIVYGHRMLEANGFSGERRIIDISGDGSDNRSRGAASARDVAVASGITINGLAILNDEPNLDEYYRRAVIGGPDAFVIAVAEYEDFADAVTRKLIREIEPPQMLSDASQAARISDERSHMFGTTAFE